MFTIQTNISLKTKNWFNTGGNARFYAAPSNLEELTTSLHFAQQQNLPIFVLGQGANILVSDDGFDGLVIHPQTNNITIIGSDANNIYVQADAGVLIQDLIEWCLDHNILGLEEFSGIPGTVGGSMYINLHYYQFLLAQFVHNAQVIDIQNHTIETVNLEWFAFGYNVSTLQQKKHILLNTTFILKKTSDLEIAYARGRRAEIIRHRAARYPQKNTCGSFFRNFYPDEVTLESNGKRMIYVAYYLDKIGVKGTLKSGDAIVSYQHANMIVNQGEATSADIIAVARMMQERVKESFGIVPQPECQLIGFEKGALL